MACLLHNLTDITNTGVDVTNAPTVVAKTEEIA